MRRSLVVCLQHYAFVCAIGAGAACRLLGVFWGLGPAYVRDKQAQLLPLLRPQPLAGPASTAAAEAQSPFSAELLPSLARGAAAWLPRDFVEAPEVWLVAIGLSALLVRLAFMIGLWRLCRGYLGSRRLGHRAWPALGFVQGGLGVALLLGMLGLAQAPQTSLMVALREDLQARAVIVLGATLDVSLLGERQLALAQYARLDEVWLEGMLDAFEQAQTPANRFVFAAEDRQAGELMLILAGQSCMDPAVHQGGWPYRLGAVFDRGAPKPNGALLLYRCSGTDVAFRQRTRPPSRPV